MKKYFPKFLYAVISATLISAVFTGCAKPAEEPLPPSAQPAGGWTYATEFEKPELPAEAQDAFDRATESLDGAGYEAVAYLGSQVVAGVNYAFLCKITPVVPNAESSLAVVKIGVNLQNEATILDTRQIDITDYTEDKELNFSDNTGGFYVKDAVGGNLDEYAQASFDKATEGLAGTGYTPLARLASKVVAGSIDAILCKATRVTAEPKTALAVVLIYTAPGGGAEIQTICGFDI